MSKIEGIKPVGYNKDDVQTDYTDEKKMKKINSLFTDGSAAPKVAYTLDVGNSIFGDGTNQPSQTAVQA